MSTGTVEGQLVSFDVQPGLVVAQVQGSRKAPYVANVQFASLFDEQWRGVQREIEATLQFSARLLGGEVPAELEDVFERAGVSRLPRRWGDLGAACSCPDWEVPCKHIEAVLYVLADRLDDDPWLLLTWRGRTRDQLLAHLRAGERAADSIAPWWPLTPGAPLPFEASVPARMKEPEPSATLARLGPLDVEVRGRPVTDVLAAAYEALADG